jgi:large subunit ribosomal protein L10
MENIGRLIKNFSINYIKKNLEGSECAFIVRYSQISAPQLSNFRSILKASSARFMVAKNSILSRIFKTEGLEVVIPMLEGPCGIIWAKGDPVAVAKVIFNFAKENEGLKIKGGILKDRILSSEEVKQLALLPSKDILYGQLTHLLKAPISHLVLTLKEVPRRLVWVLNSIKDKKGGSS